jgi:FtsH-binding integral membrane protein
MTEELPLGKSEIMGLKFMIYVAPFIMSILIPFAPNREMSNVEPFWVLLLLLLITSIVLAFAAKKLAVIGLNSPIKKKVGLGFIYTLTVGLTLFFGDVTFPPHHFVNSLYVGLFFLSLGPAIGILSPVLNQSSK